MVIQIPEIKVTELRYFKFQLKMMNIDVTVVDNQLKEQIAKRSL